TVALMMDWRIGLFVFGIFLVAYDNSDLATALGIENGIMTLGNNAAVTLNSGYEVTATAKGDGTKVVVSDRSGFEMVIDTNGATAGKKANIQVLDAGQVVLQVGANEGQEIELSIPAATCEALDITYVNVNTQDNASASITMIDDAIGQVSAIRSKLGAYQNRLESAIKSLDTSALNLTESVSRIEDTDMAEEMANYTQYNVLTQAGTSMLAQANNRPQQILQLLQG
ncbi:MAG: flagellin, partial [Lachnospiraceae bacterium]|nr:flagellin [Lachnospiraceae bacterium]